MKLKDVIADQFSEPIEKTDDEKAQPLEITKLRYRLNGLNNQQLNLWEMPTHPLFAKLDADLTYQIEKTELELAVMTTEQHQQLNRNNAFFQRGGSSVRSQATVSDSAYEQRDKEVRKAEQQIDLSPINTQSDFNSVNKTNGGEIAKIDLSSLKF